MKLIFASDSFKGTLTSDQTARLLRKAADAVFGKCDSISVSLADGGEGTIDAIIKELKGKKIYVDIHDPLMNKIRGYYGMTDDGIAIVEMAVASGLTLVPEEKRNPSYTTSFGTGELVMDAIKRGAKEVIIAIGGSATNDGGMGFATALGVRFITKDRENHLYAGYSMKDGKTLGSHTECKIYYKDEENLDSNIYYKGETNTNNSIKKDDMYTGEDIHIGINIYNGMKIYTGADLDNVIYIDLSHVPKEVKNCKFTVMCDVDNPLCGPNGATHIYARQKGASDDDIVRLENGMINYRDVIKSEFNVNPDNIKGSGAAGGMGAALAIVFNAKVKSGIETVLDIVGFDELIKDADLIVTGEGKADYQSACGKVISGVAKRGKKSKIPVIAICGCLGDGYEKLYNLGVSEIYSVSEDTDESKSIASPEEFYYKKAVEVFKEIAESSNI